MSDPAMPDGPRVLVCRCGRGGVVPRETADRVAERLGAVGATVVDDLCRLAARRDPVLRQIAGAERVWIAACHPRAVRALFSAADAPLPDEGSTLLNLRTQAAEEVLAAVPEDLECEPLTVADDDGDWMPWFPAIDRDRCKNCKQCLNFCLFGVYETDDEGRVRVANPAQCKTYCPACARVCPEVAVIFPKYESGPISGEEVGPDGLGDEPVGVDLARLADGDVYAALRARQGEGPGRFSTDPAQQQARDERRRHLLAAAEGPGGVVSLDQLISAVESARRQADGPASCPCDQKDCERSGADEE